MGIILLKSQSRDYLLFNSQYIGINLKYQCYMSTEYQLLFDSCLKCHQEAGVHFYPNFQSGPERPNSLSFIYTLKNKS